MSEATTKSDPEVGWEGRAVAREITSGLAVEETRERLQHFLESRRVASLHLGNHRTGTLREVEARTLTEYLAFPGVKLDKDIDEDEKRGKPVFDSESQKVMVRCGTQFGTQNGAERAVEAVDAEHAVRNLLSEFRAY